MPYGSIDEYTLSKIDGLQKDSSIVTYCGCPRHLSTLAAKDLTDQGYTNVSVLYEGYWVWKDNGYPVEINTTASAPLSNLSFDGVAQNNHSDKNHMDIFIRHKPSGQLEAVRTDELGRFSVDFHVYNFDVNDEFEVIIDDLKAKPLFMTKASLSESNFLEIVL